MGKFGTYGEIMDALKWLTDRVRNHLRNLGSFVRNFFHVIPLGTHTEPTPVFSPRFIARQA